MRKGNPYLGGGRYIQAENASGRLGSELKRLRTRKAYILGGRTALSIALPRMEVGLRAEGIEYAVEEFTGHCTVNKYTEISRRAAEFGAEIIVGVGGGKALDTAKMVATTLGLGVVTVPTSSATCAAYAFLSVIYSDSGDVLYSFFHEREILAILVDTDIIINHCPPRMLASGIADAAAKYPEIAFSMEYAQDWEKSVLPSAALAMSKFDWEQFVCKGAKAVADAKTHRISDEVEDCLCAAIALTGTVSSLVSGGRQLAIAHTFYDSVCKNFKAQQKKYLHGEIVSVGISLQMYVNGMGEKEIDEAKRFLSSIGAPVAMRDIDIESSPSNIDVIYTYIVKNMGLDKDWMLERLRYGLEKVIS